jgi:hypothetical protein
VPSLGAALAVPADGLALPMELLISGIEGLVMAYAQLARIPAVGDRFAWRERWFDVVAMDGRREDKLRLVAGPRTW